MYPSSVAIAMRYRYVVYLLMILFSRKALRMQEFKGMKEISMSEFSKLCDELTADLSMCRYVYDTENQPQPSYPKMVATYHNFVSMQAPDRVCFANDADKIVFENIQKILVCNGFGENSYIFKFICNDGDEPESKHEYIMVADSYNYNSLNSAHHLYDS